MDKSLFLDFDEAVLFLKTTRSTLYKWLQAGKIPGHKLGRQWRFLKHELQEHVSGVKPLVYQKELLGLSELLESRSGNSALRAHTVAENLIWDAFHFGARAIHVTANAGKFEVRYRGRKGLESLVTIGEDAFQTLDHSLRQTSVATHDEDSRRLFLVGEKAQALQVRYLKIETLSGPRLTLNLFQPQGEIMPLEQIIESSAPTLSLLKNWTSRRQGLILLSGSTGSGKAAILNSLLLEIKKSGASIITLESTVTVMIDGVSQVELNSKTAQSFENAFEKIYHSDADVIALKLSDIQELQKYVIVKAVAAAQTGHLVLVQVNAANCEDATKIFKKFCGTEGERTLIGACHQKLTVTPKGWRAHYEHFSADVNE